MTGPSRIVALALLSALAGCSSDAPVAEPPLPSSPPTSSRPTSTSTPTPSPSPTPTRTPEPEPGTVPPPWLGTRPLPLRPDGYGQAQPTPPELDPRRFTLPDTVAPLPGDGFASEVGEVPPDVLSRSTWEPGCPVGADELAYVRLTFWGFDDQRHTGELLLNGSVGRGRGGRVPRPLPGPVPDGGAPDHHEAGARRRADRRRQHHGCVRVPAHHRLDHDVQPARLRAGHRRQPVPEPLPEGRSGAPRARVVVPASRRRAARHGHAAAVSCARSRRSAGSGAATGSR